MKILENKGGNWETLWEVRMTGEQDRPWAIYGNNVLCWYHDRFTTAAMSVKTGLRHKRWDTILKKWKPSFLVDGVDFPNPY